MVRARTILSYLVLTTGGAGLVHASSVVCLMGPTGNTLVTTSCGQTFNSNEFMNWGAPTGSGGLGEAINPPSSLGQPVDTTASGGSGWVINDPIAVSSNMLIERADNTEFAWDQSLGSWVSPTYLVYGVGGSTSINTFAGHFNAPNLETNSSPYSSTSGYYGTSPQFGDPLLSAMANPQQTQQPCTTNSQAGCAQMSFNFGQSLFGVAFEVSNRSGQDSNFTATLDAYDSSGNLIGVYQVNDTAGGGTCPGLNNPNTPPNFSDPAPCNDAPIIQFYDPEGRIKSVVLTVNDNQGLFVDGLYLDVTTPDPGPATLIGGGLVVLALVARRLNRPRNSKGHQSRV